MHSNGFNRAWPTQCPREQVPVGALRACSGVEPTMVELLLQSGMVACECLQTPASQAVAT